MKNYLDYLGLAVLVVGFNSTTTKVWQTIH